MLYILRLSKKSGRYLKKKLLTVVTLIRGRKEIKRRDPMRRMQCSIDNSKHQMLKPSLRLYRKSKNQKNLSLITKNQMMKILIIEPPQTANTNKPGGVLDVWYRTLQQREGH